MIFPACVDGQLSHFLVCLSALPRRVDTEEAGSAVTRGGGHEFVQKPEINAQEV